MRKIKFRAWDNILEKYTKNSIDMGYNNTSGEFCPFGGNRYSFEQYTGHGNVFENDFLEEGLVFWSDYYLGWFVKLFENCVEENEEKPLYECSKNIIGNIHENHQLFEQEKCTQKHT